jgi:CheY-like chemotaxis protein
VKNSALLVLPDRAFARSLAAALVELGCEVQTATTGEAGLARIHERVPDMIVIDLVLPRMSGVLFAQLVRAAHATRELVLFAVTSLYITKVQRVAHEAGFHDCYELRAPRELAVQLHARYHQLRGAS